MALSSLIFVCFEDFASLLVSSICLRRMSSFSHMHSVRAFADIIVSDLFIALGLLGWAACTIVALMSKRPKALATMVLAWATYSGGAGPLHYDPWIMQVLKTTFCRVRPSPMHDSFSFPSGHTASATFLVGALLFVLLPGVLGVAAEHRSSSVSRALNQANSSNDSSNSSAQISSEAPPTAAHRDSNSREPARSHQELSGRTDSSSAAREKSSLPRKHQLLAWLVHNIEVSVISVT